MLRSNPAGDVPNRVLLVCVEMTGVFCVIGMMMMIVLLLLLLF